MNYRTKILNKIIQYCSANRYLEIGVRNLNNNFNHIDCAIKDAVDPNPIPWCKYKMTSDNFFQKYANEKYDVIFVDGLHTKYQTYIDVQNAIKFLNQDGFIIMHDCNPIEKYHTRSYEDYLKTRGTWNGDVYKAFIKLKYELHNWSCFVVDEDFGCGILTQHTLKQSFSPLTEMYSTEWENFNKNRNTLLDLISYSTFINIMSVQF